MGETNDAKDFNRKHNEHFDGQSDGIEKSMTNKEYDLIVIGAGGAGSTVASSAAGMGKRVALIERDKLGGTCLNYGCDPTKTLLHTAHLLYQAQHASTLGLRIPQAKADWAAVQAHVRQVQKTIRGGTLEQAPRALRRRA